MKDPFSQSTDPILNCLEEIIWRIESDSLPLTNRELIEICAASADIFRQNADPHICHEIAEAALNLLIQRNYARALLHSENPKGEVKTILKPLMRSLPTQSWRSSEQILWHQFSTPPTIAYLLNYLLNCRDENTILEPSAGTGSLAVWPRGAGCRTVTNEIDPRRTRLLRILGFNPSPWNAEFIDDFLPPEIKPDCLLMNPPFSANGGRTGNKTSYGFRHVESALERLSSGGKFGVVLGASAGLDSAKGYAFWKKVSDKITLRTIIRIDGREYSKYGTSVDVNLFIGVKNSDINGRKHHFSRHDVIEINAPTIETAFDRAQRLNIRLP